MEAIQPKTSLLNGTTTPGNNGQGTAKSGLSDIPGQISLDDAIKGGESAKINTVSLDPLNPGAGNSGNQVKAGSMIEAKLVLEMHDALIPSLLVVLFHKFNLTIEKSVFKFTAKEKETLAPLLQNCLDSLLINFNNPWIALTVTYLVMQGAKVAEHGGIAMLDKKKDKRKQEKFEQQAKSDPSMKEVSEVLRPYDEDDIQKVIRKRQKGREDAVIWLEKFWVKKKGVI